MRLTALLLALALSASAQIPLPTDAPKPLTPGESAAAFKLPDGLRMEVVASEPLIASPSAVCWDERGGCLSASCTATISRGRRLKELNKSGRIDTQVAAYESINVEVHARRSAAPISNL